MGKLFTIFGLLGLVALIGLSGCSSKAQSGDGAYYDRANKASSESLRGLDKE